jgi:hypothetical protein
MERKDNSGLESHRWFSSVYTVIFYLHGSAARAFTLGRICWNLDVRNCVHVMPYMRHANGAWLVLLFFWLELEIVETISSHLCASFRGLRTHRFRFQRIRSFRFTIGGFAAILDGWKYVDAIIISTFPVLRFIWDISMVTDWSMLL